MKSYSDFVKLITEGLIKTHNIIKYNTSLSIELNSIGINHNIEIIDKMVYLVKIFNPFVFSDEDVFELFMSFNNNLGYFPSWFRVFKQDKYIDFEWSENLFNKNINCDELWIRFEGKYEDGLYNNILDVPNVAYHLSPVNNRKRIEDGGLYPKSGYRKTYHPDRIYLFYNLEDCDKLLKQLKINDINSKDYDLWEVKLSSDNVIHTDPNYSKGFFTYDNISPERMELIKKDL
jgi:hypothetical protein